MRLNLMLIDFTPVAATELVMSAQLQYELAKRHVKLMALTTHDTTAKNKGNV